MEFWVVVECDVVLSEGFWCDVKDVIAVNVVYGRVVFCWYDGCDEVC